MIRRILMILKYLKLSRVGMRKHATRKDHVSIGHKKMTQSMENNIKSQFRKLLGQLANPWDSVQEKRTIIIQKMFLKLSTHKF